MIAETDQVAALQQILSGDPVRSRILGLVSTLGLPDCWIGAGFVRNAVWDHLHGRAASCSPHGDVDVIWFDRYRVARSEDARLEADLRARDPSINWSVKNQARMHLRNGDAPYRSTTDAMLCWPETATAVAARRAEKGHCEIAAPFGLGDLFGLVLRPTPRFMGDKHYIFLSRVQTKGWLAAWPLLTIGGAAGVLTPKFAALCDGRGRRAGH
jgi:uncharacterized protein